MTMPGSERAIDVAAVLTAARAAAALLVVDVALRMVGLHRVRLWLGTERVATATSGDDVDRIIARTCLAVDRACRHHVYAVRCLARSLVTQWLLGGRGVPTDLRIGVRKEAGRLQAHAWVEYRGQRLGEPVTPGEHFVPLVSAGVGR